MSRRDPFLQVRNLQKAYLLGRFVLPVLRGCSLNIDEGEFVAIMGSSGSGKSTLLHIAGALDTPDRGTVSFEGHDVFAMPASGRDRLRNQVFGFVFQFYHLLPELNILENVLLPAMVGSSVLGWFSRRAAARAAAEEMIEQVGLTGRIKHRPNELSGGERQRVAIARALVNRPRILLADEPTGNLDTTTGRGILTLLKRLSEQGQTIVLVTHDASVAAGAHRTVTLVDGQIRSHAAGGPAKAADSVAPSS
ncbi:MAG: ABC transporter ATP-binding protein [Phycisphaerae bacterium]|nr:ABC transporter ATP-binding protein [Phycisphaerae bacterium]